MRVNGLNPVQKATFFKKMKSGLYSDVIFVENIQLRKTKLVQKISYIHF